MYLGGVRGKTHEFVAGNDEIATGIAGHFGELVGQLLETGAAVGVQHPALDHDHVHVDGARRRLRQPLALLQQIGHFARRHVLVRSTAVRQQLPHRHTYIINSFF